MIAVKTYKKQERVDYKSLIVANKATQNYDPTRTTVLRAQFMKDMDRRFVSLGRLIKQAIIEDDVFGLIEPKHDLIKIITVNETPGKEAFKFSTSQDKVSQFMAWLKQQEKKGLLQTTTIPQIGTPLEKAWTDQYIQDSYKRGVTRARYEMGAAGMGTPGIEETGGISASMSTPFHMDRVGMLYARTFEDLIGVTAQMDSAISRILSQGMVDGDGPRSLAVKIVDATGVSRRRAMTLARTEIIRAHHSAMVQEYKNWAVEGVVVKAEWVDAGFNVCPECAKNNGKIFDLNEIEGLIPLHPNCRCIALPTMPEKGVKTVEKVSEKAKDSNSINKIDFYNLTKEDYEKVWDTTPLKDNEDYFLRFTENPAKDLKRESSIHLTDFSTIKEAKEDSPYTSFIKTKDGLIGEKLQGLAAFPIESRDFEDALEDALFLIEKRKTSDANAAIFYDRIPVLYKGVYKDDIPDGIIFKPTSIVQRIGYDDMIKDAIAHDKIKK
jgi:SPP1 gp7 family putative phage head morphogenesis protein